MLLDVLWPYRASLFRAFVALQLLVVATVGVRAETTTLLPVACRVAACSNQGDNRCVSAGDVVVVVVVVDVVVLVVVVASSCFVISGGSVMDVLLLFCCLLLLFFCVDGCWVLIVAAVIVGSC